HRAVRIIEESIAFRADDENVRQFGVISAPDRGLLYRDFRRGVPLPVVNIEHGINVLIEIEVMVTDIDVPVGSGNMRIPEIITVYFGVTRNGKPAYVVS